MKFLDLIKKLFARLFGADTEEGRKRAELRRIYAILSKQPLPYFRPKKNQVLPGFAEILFAWARSMRPLHDLILATVANTDSRVAQKHIDFLIECRLPVEAFTRKDHFSYDNIASRMHNSLDPEKDFEALEAEFREFTADIDRIEGQRLDEELGLVERFIDIVRFDCTRFLAMFDPDASLDSRAPKPAFSPLEADLALPELLDLHYVLEGFEFAPTLRDNLTKLFERQSKASLDEAKQNKLAKIFMQLDSALSGPLSPEVILTLIRALKSDPEFVQTTPKELKKHFAAYRHRVGSQFDKDIARLRHEWRENTVMADLTTLFKDIEFMTIDGYDEETDAYLRKETPNGLLWIKPLRALRTFIVHIFEPVIFHLVTKILLEGYFENKDFQNNVANILYQCEKSSQKVNAFEVQLNGSGRFSMTAIRRYVEEMKKGKDLAPLLARLIDSVNDLALDLVRNEAMLLAMLGDALAEIASDPSIPSAATVSNLRTLGGGRNKELLQRLHSATENFALFSRIMRSFSVLAAADDTIEELGASEAVPPPGILVMEAGSSSSEVLEEL
ncbi:MAG: DUF5312 family protein [Spirochaetota bacterium]